MPYLPTMSDIEISANFFFSIFLSQSARFSSLLVFPWTFPSSLFSLLISLSLFVIPSCLFCLFSLLISFSLFVFFFLQYRFPFSKENYFPFSFWPYILLTAYVLNNRFCLLMVIRSRTLLRIKQGQQVIQGSHMVSGTRCPAWSD